MCLGSLRVLFLCSWLGVGESLVLPRVNNIFLFLSPSDFLGNLFNNEFTGINALVKSNDQKSAVNRAVPRPTIVTIDVRGNAHFP
jgi:hypothetical protein